MLGPRQLLVALFALSAGCSPAPTRPPAPRATPAPPACPRDDLKAALAARAELQLGARMKLMEGAPVCRDLEEGERMQARFTIAPDRSYAVLAHTLPEVDALELVLWADVPDDASSVLRLVADTVLAQDDGIVATIGAGEHGYRFDVVPGWTEPVPVVAEVKVVAGAGPVAVAPYEGQAGED